MATASILERLRSSIPTVSVGMMTANLLELGSEISLLEGTGVELLHFDVMDGCFCPMSTIGAPIVKAIRTSLVKDVHLMISDPLEKVGDYVRAGADMITVHAEADRYVHRVLQELGTMENVNDPDRGLVRGVALNPGTPVSVLEPLLDQLEYVLLLAINPGWGGQAFGVETPRRIEQARGLIADSGREILLGVDGGVTRKNIAAVAGLGADLIVTGSAVFDGVAPADNAKYMLESTAAARVS